MTEETLKCPLCESIQLIGYESFNYYCIDCGVRYSGELAWELIEKIKQKSYDFGQQKLFEYFLSLDEKSLCTVLIKGYEKYYKESLKELEK